MTDQKIFNGLIDFSDLRKKQEDFHSNSSKNSALNNLDLDCESYEQIMKSFKELRDKLKLTNKENQSLREEMNSMQIQQKQIMQSQTNLMSINHQLKQKMAHLQLANDQYKKKLSLMKEQLTQKRALSDQLAFLKSNLIDYKMSNDRLQEQKKKIIQISLEQKMNFQEQMNKIKTKRQKQQKYMYEIQSQLSKSKQTIMKLQNQLKKMEIKLDQEAFNKKWSKDNFEKEYYQKVIKDLNGEIVDLKNRSKKEKDRRASIEQRILQLEEISGLWNVKAEAYEGQVQIMHKKMKKIERRMSQTKTNANKMAHEKVSYEQKFYKCSQLLEELINRVKRQLMGDAVELAKSCQYRLNKIKQTDRSEFSKISARERENQSLSLGKKNLTEKKSKKNDKNTGTTLCNMQLFTKCEVQSQKNGILQQKNTNKSSGSDIKMKSRSTTVNGNKENEDLQLQNEYNNLENKIRRERDQMQRKLKEKMLYRKIEVSSSPQKSKLREDYLKFMITK